MYFQIRPSVCFRLFKHRASIFYFFYKIRLGNGGHQIMVEICTNVRLLPYNTADNFGRCLRNSLPNSCVRTTRKTRNFNPNPNPNPNFNPNPNRPSVNCIQYPPTRSWSRLVEICTNVRLLAYSTADNLRANSQIQKVSRQGQGWGQAQGYRVRVGQGQ